jgi:hypothetical protein
MFKRNAEAEKEYWLQAKARGENWFVWRSGVLPTLLIWFVILPAVQVFVGRTNPFSASFVVAWLVLLPVTLLGGYLRGRWRWKDFEKKFPG